MGRASFLFSTDYKETRVMFSYSFGQNKSLCEIFSVHCHFRNNSYTKPVHMVIAQRERYGLCSASIFNGFPKNL